GVVGHQGNGNGQKLNVVLGKIQRIDVDGNNSANGRYGIPADNPFVNTAGARKEIWAYGLRNPYRMSFDTATGALIAGDIAQYDTDTEGVSVIGGFVYHGTRFPELQGHYVFGDFTRIFIFPSGPDNYGRLFYLQEKSLTSTDLHTVKEFQGLAQEAARLGL